MTLLKVKYVKGGSVQQMKTTKIVITIEQPWSKAMHEGFPRLYKSEQQYTDELSSDIQKEISGWIDDKGMTSIRTTIEEGESDD